MYALKQQEAEAQAHEIIEHPEFFHAPEVQVEDEKLKAVITDILKPSPEQPDEEVLTKLEEILKKEAAENEKGN